MVGDTVWIAAIVAVGAVGTAWMNAHQVNKGKREDALQRSKDKEEDYARQDAVAEKAAKAADKVAQVARQAAEAAELLVTSNAETARLSAIANAENRIKLEEIHNQAQQIHILVNNNLSLAIERELIAMEAALVAMVDNANLQSKLGLKPTEEAKSAIEDIKKRIDSLKVDVVHRVEQTELAKAADRQDD